MIARLLERYAEEVDIALHDYGSTMFRREAKARGLEPDECYCIGMLKELPDFAIEVNLTGGGVDKLAMYYCIKGWVYQSIDLAESAVNPS